MKKMLLDDFIRYAKEEFNCDIHLKASDRPDTFESIFGASFLNEEETGREIDSFDDDLCYENIAIKVNLVIDNEIDKEFNENIGLAA